MKTKLLFWISLVAWHAHTFANWTHWDWLAQKMYRAHGWAHCAWLRSHVADTMKEADDWIAKEDRSHDS